MWYWEPDKADLEPRPERWGGLLCVLAGVYLYAGVLRRDALVRRLTLWAFLGGAIGFPLGQSLQAWHAWNFEAIRAGSWAELDEVLNWWNIMETTFGATMGGLLGLGLWRNRHLIDPGTDEPVVELTPSAEWILAAFQIAAVAAWNFGSFRALDRYADIALTMVLLPVVATAAGRIFPYLVVLPIVAMPIAGKTLRELCYDHAEWPLLQGWLVLLVLPLVVTTAAALVFARGARLRHDASRFAPAALLITAWTYFLLNHAFFRFPYPWNEGGWTNRTPNDLVYIVCTVSLTIFAVFRLIKPAGAATATATEPSPAQPAAQPA
jgi:hypothetical protein